TNRCLRASIATPATSPRYMFAGSLRKSVLASKRISGTACWAAARFEGAPRPINAVMMMAAEGDAAERIWMRMEAIMPPPEAEGQAALSTWVLSPTPEMAQFEKPKRARKRQASVSPDARLTLSGVFRRMSMGENGERR